MRQGFVLDPDSKHVRGEKGNERSEHTFYFYNRAHLNPRFNFLGRSLVPGGGGRFRQRDWGSCPAEQTVPQMDREGTGKGIGSLPESGPSRKDKTLWLISGEEKDVLGSVLVTP